MSDTIKYLGALDNEAPAGDAIKYLGGLDAGKDTTIKYLGALDDTPDAEPSFVNDVVVKTAKDIGQGVKKYATETIPAAIKATTKGRALPVALAGLATMPISGYAGLAGLPFGKSGKFIDAVNNFLPSKLYPEEQEGVSEIGEIFTPMGIAGEGYEQIVQQTPLKDTVAEPIAKTLGDIASLSTLGGAGLRVLKGKAEAGARGLSAKNIEKRMENVDPRYGEVPVNAESVSPTPRQTPVIAPIEKEKPIEQPNPEMKQVLPPEQVPPQAGLPETKGLGVESQLAKRAESDAIEAKLTEDFGQLVEYKTMDMKDQANKAQSIMDLDYEKAKRMAMGDELPPQGVREATIYEAVKIRAIKEGDIDLLHKLATQSKVPTKLSEYGQAIKAADSRLMEDPVKVAQDVAKAREERLKRTGVKTDVTKQNAEIERLSKELETTKKALDDHVSQGLDKSTERAIDEIINPKSKAERPVKVKYGTKNKLVTQESYLKARGELRSKFGTQLSAGVDPTLVAPLSKVGLYHFEAGVRSFNVWSRLMIKDLGDWVKPHLASIWEDTKKGFHTESVKGISTKITNAIAEGKGLSDVGRHAHDLAKHFVSQGVKDRGLLIKEVHSVLKESLPQITERETMDAISGYGKFKQLSKEEVDIQLRDLKGQMQQVSKLEDLQSKKPPLKTGVERRVPSDAERALIKQVEEAKKKYGIQTVDKATQLKSALDAVKTRLTNDIKDLETQIATKKKIVKEKTSLAYDAEANRLKAKRDGLKKKFDEIFSDPKKDPGTLKNEAQKRSLQKQIESLENQIKTREKVARGKIQTVHDAETTGLKAKRDLVKAEFDKVFGNTRITEAQRINLAINAVKRSIAEYSRRITNKDISPFKKKTELHSIELDKLRAEREKLKTQFQELRDLANPKKTPEQIALQTLKTRLQNETKKLNEKLTNLDFTKKEKKTTTLDIEAGKLKAEHERVKKAHKDLAEKSGTVTKEEVANLVNLSKIMEQKKAAIEQGGNRFEYGAAKVAYENYANGLKGINTPVKSLLKDRIQEFKTTWGENKNKAVVDLAKDTIKTISDSSIGMVASVDNSFLGRQGLKTLMTHPSAWYPGAKASFVDFVKTLGGKDAHDALMADIYSRPEYIKGEYQQAGILTKIEEQYPSTLPERIPGVGRVFKASEYAFTGSAIRMRTGLYDLLAKQAKENGVVWDKTQIKDVGTLINSLTARGQWGKTGEPGIVRLILWAPKMLKANIDVLTAHKLRMGSSLDTAFAKKQASRNLMKIVGETATIMMIANALKPGSAELDPRSSNFGKIKVGHTAFDITGGAGSLVTLASRIITRKNKNSLTGEIKKYGLGYGQRSPFDALIDFLVNKTTPPTHMVIDWLKGKDWSGKPFTPQGAAYRAVTPISIQGAVSLKDNASADRIAGVIFDGLGISSTSIPTEKEQIEIKIQRRLNNSSNN